MTQEQKIARGSIIIFILSIVMLLCLGMTATLAYFAGSQKSNTTLIMGGPVWVNMVDREGNDLYEGTMIMDLKTSAVKLLPGMGIDMQAIAKVSSTDTNSTPALLRAILDITVIGISENYATEVERQIRESMAECLSQRIDSKEPNARDGWVQFDDGHYYYCSEKKGYDLESNQEYVQLKAIPTSKIGSNIPFINGTFQFPYRAYTNKFADVQIIFNLTFQAIQEEIKDKDGKTLINSIFNVKQILDSVDWDTHNQY